MLVAENLVKTFERNEKKHKKVTFEAVSHVSLQVQAGEIVGVLGPNGRQDNASPDAWLPDAANRGNDSVYG